MSYLYNAMLIAVVAGVIMVIGYVCMYIMPLVIAVAFCIGIIDGIWGNDYGARLSEMVDFVVDKVTA